MERGCDNEYSNKNIDTLTKYKDPKLGADLLRHAPDKDF